MEYQHEYSSIEEYFNTIEEAKRVVDIPLEYSKELHNITKKINIIKLGKSFFDVGCLGAVKEGNVLQSCAWIPYKENKTPRPISSSKLMPRPILKVK